jgi:hypothetical protein
LVSHVLRSRNNVSVSPKAMVMLIVVNALFGWLPVLGYGAFERCAHIRCLLAEFRQLGYGG